MTRPFPVGFSCSRETLRPNHTKGSCCPESDRHITHQTTEAQSTRFFIPLHIISCDFSSDTQAVHVNKVLATTLSMSFQKESMLHHLHIELHIQARKNVTKALHSQSDNIITDGSHLRAERPCHPNCWFVRVLVPQHTSLVSFQHNENRVNTVSTVRRSARRYVPESAYPGLSSLISAGSTNIGSASLPVSPSLPLPHMPRSFSLVLSQQPIP